MIQSGFRTFYVLIFTSQMSDFFSLQIDEAASNWNSASTGIGTCSYFMFTILLFNEIHVTCLQVSATHFSNPFATHLTRLILKIGASGSGKDLAAW